MCSRDVNLVLIYQLAVKSSRLLTMYAAACDVPMCKSLCYMSHLTLTLGGNGKMESIGSWHHLTRPIEYVMGLRAVAIRLGEARSTEMMLVLFAISNSTTNM